MVRWRAEWTSWIGGLLIGLGLSGEGWALAPPPASGELGVVTSDHALASAVGARILEQGGNAADAAVATALACGVVQPSSSGLGGGGFALVVTPQQRQVLDFREVAPAGAHQDMFLDESGAVIAGASTRGALAVAVPGEARGLAELHARWGRLSLSEVVRPAWELAAKGFPAGEHLVAALEEKPHMAPLLFDDLHRVPRPGEQLTRKTLAKTLRRYARSEGEALSVGPLAESIAQTVQEQGGVLRAEDLEALQPREREALEGQYRGQTVLTMPPPSSGGAVLLQVLAALEHWDLTELGLNSGDHLHLLAELFQHAYADRAHFMGDPDFTEVPLESMLSEERIEELREAVHLAHTLPQEAYGLPVDPPRDGGTQHISVLDSEGMAVALTTTINTSFGSELVDPVSGVLLNNEMDDFVALPGVPNAFGLIGREANSVAPGKKPLSSMTPTVVLDEEGVPWIAAGASGGPFIISSTLQVLSNVLDYGLDPAEAVSAPRMHHQWTPRLLFLDHLGHPREVQETLRERGHQLELFPFFSSTQLAVRIDELYLGASDPRKGGQAVGAQLP